MVEARINLAALRSNTEIARNAAPNSRLMAVIKANAYGHGMLPVAHALQDIADGFAVARIEEALQLREDGIQNRLLVMSSLPNARQLNLCASLNIDLVVHESSTLELLENTRLNQPINLWLKIDTGMHRLGLPASTVADTYQTLNALPGVGEIVLMSHFACADHADDAMTQAQLELWSEATANISAPRSLANSAALLTRPDTHQDWIRPGIMLYGANPLGEAHKTLLAPVMTLSSRLIAVRDIPAGDTVGYNQRWLSDKPSRIGTIAAGYGDGYPRHAANGTPVLVNGQRVPLVGQVSMDMITVNLSDQPNAKAGDEVVLWGEGLAANEVAEFAGTIAYDLVTGVTLRASFSYA